MAQREAWQRGPVPGISAQLQPAAHAILHAREDLARVIPAIEADLLWRTAGDAASIGWHLLHLAGSTRRLLTYARGEPLSDEQWEWLEKENHPRTDADIGELWTALEDAFEDALAQMRDTADNELDEVRGVGRAQIPATVRGLLFHAGEHAARHAGQIITTLKVLRATAES